MACCEAAAIEFDIEHIHALDIVGGYHAARFTKLDKEFLEKAIAALPDKPWDKVAISQMASALGCSLPDIHAVIEYVSFKRIQTERRDRALARKQRRRPDDIVDPGDAQAPK
jgi:hypothetical protein